MRTSPLLLLLLVFLVGARATAGQSPAFGPAPSALFETSPRNTLAQAWVADSNTPTSHPTHWKEGAAIGGGLGLIGGLLLGSAICGLSDDTNESCTAATVGSGLGGAVALGFLGALIGGSFPKHQEADSTSP